MLGVLGEVGFYSKKLSIKWQRAVLSENASLWHRGLLKRPVVPLRYVFGFLLGSGGKSPTVWYVLVVPACYHKHIPHRTPWTGHCRVSAQIHPSFFCARANTCQALLR